MAVGATTELHVLEASGSSGHIGLMAFLASNLAMHSRKGIAGFGMVKVLCGLPVTYVVATLAILAKLSFVNVLMTARTGRGQSQIGL